MPEDIRLYYSDLGTTILTGIALAVCIMATRTYSKSEFAKLGHYFSLYLVLYLTATIIYDIYDLVLKTETFPSIADIPWVLAYVPLAYVCITTVIEYHEYSNPVYTVAIYSTIFFSAILVMIPMAVVTMGPDTELSLAGQWLSMLYPILDFFILLFIAQLVSIYWTGKLAIYWVFIVVGITFELFADITYNLFETFGVYQAGSLPDSFFMMSALFLIFGFLIIVITRQYSETLRFEPEGKYKIKHVFLVYPNGALLTYLSTPDTKIVDVDIFTGMLTVVQSFIRESFVGDADKTGKGGLDSMRYEALEIAIERGKFVYLAVVVDGRVTDRLHNKMQQVIDESERIYASKLKDWDGDLNSVDGLKKIVSTIFES